MEQTFLHKPFFFSRIQIFKWWWWNESLISFEFLIGLTEWYHVRYFSGRVVGGEEKWKRILSGNLNFFWSSFYTFHLFSSKDYFVSSHETHPTWIWIETLSRTSTLLTSLNQGVLGTQKALTRTVSLNQCVTRNENIAVLVKFCLSCGDIKVFWRAVHFLRNFSWI